MYKVGDIVVYKKEVCEISEIKEKFYRDMDYYVLRPINDKTLKLEIPVSMENKLIRNLITKEDFENIIVNMPKIAVIDCNEKEIENEYKALMQSGKHEDLVKVIKTAYLRNRERLDNNKKTTDKDETYFKLAEQYLYSELAVVYNISYEEAKKYVLDKVNNLEV